MIKKIANSVSKSDGLMILCFTSEICFFLTTGYGISCFYLLKSFQSFAFFSVSFFFGLFNAFIVGEAIRIKERRKLNG